MRSKGQSGARPPHSKLGFGHAVFSASMFKLMTHYAKGLLNC